MFPRGLQSFSARLLCLVLLCSFGGCAGPQALSAARGAVPSGMVRVVGAVALEPAFNPRLEQQTYWNVIGDERLKNRVRVAFSATPGPIQPGTLRGTGWQYFHDARFGEPFSVLVPRGAVFLTGFVVPLDVRQQDYLWYTANHRVDLSGTADTVYVGTLTVVRDDFNRQFKVEVTDQSATLSPDLGSWQTQLWQPFEQVVSEIR